MTTLQVFCLISMWIGIMVMTWGSIEMKWAGLGLLLFMGFLFIEEAIINKSK